MDKLDILRKSDMFRELNDEQLGVVAKMCTTEVFEPGTIIHKQGTKSDKLYVIIEGLVGVLLELGPLSHRQIQAASNFDVVGWSAMIEPHIASSTLKAIEKTKVLAFKGQDLNDLLLTRCDIFCLISRGIGRVIGTRLRHAYSQILGVTEEV